MSDYLSGRYWDRTSDYKSHLLHVVEIPTWFTTYTNRQDIASQIMELNGIKAYLRISKQEVAECRWQLLALAREQVQPPYKGKLPCLFLFLVWSKISI